MNTTVQEAKFRMNCKQFRKVTMSSKEHHELGEQEPTAGSKPPSL